MAEKDELKLLKRKLKQYEQVFNKMNACVYIMNQEPYQVSWMHDNDYLKRSCGYTAQQIMDMGSDFPEMIDQQAYNDESIFVAHEYFKENPKAKDWVGMYRMPDIHGNMLWVLYTSSIISWTKDGVPKEILCVAINIKEEFDTGLSFNDFVNSRQRQQYKALLATLTKREMEVLKLIAVGDAQKEIADKLKIAPSTVESHKARLFKKLQARSSVELARIAVISGILKNK